MADHPREKVPLRDVVGVEHDDELAGGHGKRVVQVARLRVPMLRPRDVLCSELCRE